MPSFTPCCAHDHDCADEDCGAAYSLYKHIDMPRVRRMACRAGRLAGERLSSNE